MTNRDFRACLTRALDEGIPPDNDEPYSPEEHQHSFSEFCLAYLAELNGEDPEELLERMLAKRDAERDDPPPEPGVGDPRVRKVVNDASDLALDLLDGHRRTS